MTDHPQFEHDGPCCTFLGRHVGPSGPCRGRYDLYYCSTTGSLIARYGDDGQEYHSVNSRLSGHERILALDPNLAEARRRAVAAGLLEEPTP